MSSLPERAERRRHPRSASAYRLEVEVPGCESDAYLVDVSVGGAQIRHSGSAPLEDARRIRIRLPKWLHLGSELALDGSIAWFRQVARERFECGFVFEELRGSRRDVVVALIAKLREALEEDGLAPVDDSQPELDDEVPLGLFL